MEIIQNLAMHQPGVLLTCRFWFSGSGQPRSLTGSQAMLVLLDQAVNLV